MNKFLSLTSPFDFSLHLNMIFMIFIIYKDLIVIFMTLHFPLNFNLNSSSNLIEFKTSEK